MFYFIHLIEIVCIVQFIMVFVILSLYGLSYDENYWMSINKNDYVLLYTFN